MSRPRRLLPLLVAAMAAATYAPIAVGQLAGFIIDDLGITRTELGSLAAVAAIAGAAVSATVGKRVDALGGRLGLLILFAGAAAGFAGLGLAPSFVIMIAAMALAGIVQAAGNPVTNLLIAHWVSPGRRGAITGIKQSGVQLGVFIGGILAPAGAVTIGWRPTLLVVAGLLVVLAALSSGIPDDRGDRPTGHGNDPAAGPFIRPAFITWLATYGFLLGFAGSMVYFIPLYAEEVLGMSRQTGGLASSVVGLSAVVARIAWGRFAERTGRFRWSLAVIAAGGVLAVGLFGLAASASWLIWPAAVVFGATASSWNSVGMLAIIARGPRGAGASSGQVLVGYLAGLGVGPIVLAWIVDQTSAYATSWLVSGVVYLLGVGLTRRPAARTLAA
ncbi:MAG: MFS transporter [Acidimicrobiia bacterium]|nr:MFS transporter [Acidimicrobiia bacterium]